MAADKVASAARRRGSERRDGRLNTRALSWAALHAAPSEDCPDDSFKSTDFSLVFGAGLELNRFSLQGRYDMRLGSVADADGVDVKNSGGLITLGYGFRIR